MDDYGYKVSPEELVAALKTIQRVCLSYEDCSSECPLYIDGCKFAGAKFIAPDQWEINDSFTDWHAFKR